MLLAMKMIFNAVNKYKICPVIKREEFVQETILDSFHF